MGISERSKPVPRNVDHFVYSYHYAYSKFSVKLIENSTDTLLRGTARTKAIECNHDPRQSFANEKKPIEVEAVHSKLALTFISGLRLSL